MTINRDLSRLPVKANVQYRFAAALVAMFYAINGALLPEDNPMTVQMNDEYVVETVRTVARLAWVAAASGVS